MYLIQTAKRARSLCHSYTQEKATVLFEQLYPESTAGSAKKRASFKQDVSFIIYNKNKCIKYHNIEH